MKKNTTQNGEDGWWKTPWGYKESFLIVSGIILVGVLLHFATGLFSYSLLLFPNNVIVMGVILATSLAFSFKAKSPLFQWLSGVPLSVAILCGILFYSLIMGFTMQSPPTQKNNSILAFDAVTRSWSFVLLYGFCLFNLSCVVAKRLHSFVWSDYAFYLNHFGLLLLLMAAGLGAADLRRYVMHVEEGNTEWRVYSDHGHVMELPIAIKLNDFYMEEFMPKLAIIDKRTGDVLPKGNPFLWQIDTLKNTTHIAGWSITMDQFIGNAVRMSDSTFREVHMPGSCPAALVTATKNGEVRQGWVSGGNFAQHLMTVTLSDTTLLVMTRPDPSKFLSQVVVYSQSGKTIETEIEVNKPLRIEHWMIYQYSYDSDRGKASTYSSFELVYDPWIKLVYFGIILFLLGSVCMLWEGNKKKKINDDTLG